MTTPATPTDPKTAAPAKNHEETLREAWARYGNGIYLICGLVALGILAKGGWDYLNAQKELGIRNEYSLCVTPDSFRSFAANHPGHPLAGVAEVAIADNSYATGKYADAVTGYTAAIGDLPVGPVQSRARMGLAMSLALSGKTAEAETNLKQMLNDTNLLKAVRCEAGYHLASLALGEGKKDEVRQVAEQVMQIDATSPFAERAFALRSSVPDTAVVKAGAVSVP